jgi:hypothetical protein
MGGGSHGARIQPPGVDGAELTERGDGRSRLRSGRFFVHSSIHTYVFDAVDGSIIPRQSTCLMMYSTGCQKYTCNALAAEI